MAHPPDKRLACRRDILGTIYKGVSVRLLQTSGSEPWLHSAQPSQSGDLGPRGPAVCAEPHLQLATPEELHKPPKQSSFQDGDRIKLSFGGAAG